MSVAVRAKFAIMYTTKACLMFSVSLRASATMLVTVMGASLDTRSEHGSVSRSAANASAESGWILRTDVGGFSALEQDGGASGHVHANDRSGSTAMLTSLRA